MLPLIPVVLVLLLVRCLTDRAWLRGLGITAVAIATTYASNAFATVVFDAVWDNPAESNTVETVWKRLPRLTDNLASALGQTWYQLAATAGITAIGSGVLLVRAVHRRGGNVPDRVIRDARLVILSTLPLVLVAIVFMSNRTRTDHRIYGRYNDAVLWPVLIVGIAWLVQLRRTPHPRLAAAGLVGVAVAIVAAGFGIDAVAGEALADSVGVRPMVSGLMPMIGSARAIDVVKVTVVSVAVLALLVIAALSPRRGAVLALLGVAMLSVAGVRTKDALSLRLNSWAPATEVVAIDELIPPDAPIGVKFVREKDKPNVTWDDQRRRAQLYQFALPGHRFSRDNGPDDNVGPYVFAPSNDAALREAGAEILWVESQRVKMALWKEPTAP
jgi:hypothetical protein